LADTWAARMTAWSLSVVSLPILSRSLFVGASAGRVAWSSAGGNLRATAALEMEAEGPPPPAPLTEPTLVADDDIVWDSAETAEASEEAELRRPLE
jgi:hypothetical protein